MRSPLELLFRLRQEGMNLVMWGRPPRLQGPLAGAPIGLPSPVVVARQLTGTPYAAEVLRLADEITKGRLPLFGELAETGPEIRWRRDWFNGTESGTAYFRRIPYLDFARAGDHKRIWEMNRLQHWVLLAQAHLLNGDGRYVEEILQQWRSWRAQNPWMRGINWASALEVAFRALSWLWVDHLIGHTMDAAVRARFLDDLYSHGRYLENNLSIYFSPNTHLLGEAVALHALGVAYPQWPQSGRWRRLGSELVERQIARQVKDDGSHFEQSTYYSVYALDLFLFHAILGPVSDTYWRKLSCMADFLAALLGQMRELPLLGDDDGGRLFHPYGIRTRFGRATIATAALLLKRDNLAYDTDDCAEQACWWLGKAAPGRKASIPSSHLFRDSGLAVMTSGEVQAVFDAGPMGVGGAGHSHSDALSLVVNAGGREILIDPGTFTYVADPAVRDAFRGSAAHNTLRINGMDQAKPCGPFRWRDLPVVRLLDWKCSPEEDQVVAVCNYGEFSHRRRVVYRKPGLFVIIDDVEGPRGVWLVEQFWHAAQEVTSATASSFHIGSRARLVVEPIAARIEDGWRSRVHGQKNPAPVVVVSAKVSLPVRWTTVLDVTGETGYQQLEALRVKAGLADK
ncbi:MAG: alginate lyase family protein [Bryobacteraceae bacterium]